MAATNLPAEFVGKPPIPLRKKRPHKRDFRNLPFVASSRRNMIGDFAWNLPATGGYFGGSETGRAMALAFLKALRNTGDDSARFWLGSVVGSMLVRSEQLGGSRPTAKPAETCWEEPKSFRGQYCGFFWTLSDMLILASRQYGGYLDGIDDREILRLANAGLGFDEAAYTASLNVVEANDE